MTQTHSRVDAANHCEQPHPGEYCIHGAERNAQHARVEAAQDRAHQGPRQCNRDQRRQPAYWIDDCRDPAHEFARGAVEGERSGGDDHRRGGGAEEEGRAQSGIEAGQVRHDDHEEPGGDQGDPEDARQADPLADDRHQHCARYGTEAEVCPQQPVVAGGSVQIAGNEEIAQGLQRAEAKPGQHLGDQDGAQHHVAGDIAHPVQELAREVARLARSHAVSRGRRVDSDGRQEHDHERERIEHERPPKAKAEDQHSGHRRPNEDRQALDGLERLERLVLPRLRNNVLDEGELGRDEELGEDG